MITAIQMFKSGVTPAWEDPVNEKGSEFRVELKNVSGDSVQDLWQRAIFDMVTGRMPHIKDGVAGFRLVQRQKSMTFTNYRVEVWMTVEDEKSAIVEDIKKYIEDELIKKLGDGSNYIQAKFESRADFKKDHKY